MELPINIHLQTVLQALAALSIVTFVASLLCIPLLIARLPRDYFLPSQARQEKHTRWLTPSAIVLFILRNLIGFLLLLAGIAMLFLPGQGIITIIIGVALMSFPYKRRLLARLTEPAKVRSSLDWLRRKMNRQPFLW